MGDGDPLEKITAGDLAELERDPLGVLEQAAHRRRSRLLRAWDATTPIRRTMRRLEQGVAARVIALEREHERLIERAHANSRHRLFALHAMVRAGKRGDRPPAWATEALESVLREITDDGVNPRRALRLDAPGQIEDYRNWMHRADRAWEVRQLIAAGQSKNAAIEEIAHRYNVSNTTARRDFERFFDSA